MGTTKQYPEEIRAEAVKRYLAGESSPKIAADLGCSAWAVLSWVNKSFETPEPERSVKQMDENKTPAAAGTVTDVSTNINIDRRNDSPYSYDTTYAEFCQAMLVQIIELADDIISDDSADAEVAGYAGMIKGLATAMREVFTNNGR